MAWLKCGHESSGSEEVLSKCSRCWSSLLTPVKKCANYTPYYDRYVDSVFYSEWDVVFSCGHKDTIRYMGKGAWCLEDKSWQEFDLTKEKEMSWDGKKFWILYIVSDGGFHSANQNKYETLAAAEAEAETRSAASGKTYLVLESVAGFRPKENTERIKFRK